jgi:glutamate N-acetyltransferase/amino-acid N-acetyltransferase
MKNLDAKNFSVPGYKAWGIHCGIKKTDKKDLAIIISDREASVAGVFTKNRVKAASVVIGAAKVKSGKGRIIVANSGCANACTGKQGFADARETAEIAAAEFGARADQVYVASTGVIGETLPVPKIRTGVATAAGLLSPSGWGQAAEAIMTTDIYPKIAAVQEEIGGKHITIAGIAKGSGMIHPDMATMLCFIVTDAAVAAPMLRKMLIASVDRSFNVITVDGDTSTNDMVLCMANGAAGNKRVAPGTKDAKKLQACLDAVTRSLAMQVVKDGEGATKFVRVEVVNAGSDREALKGARAIANSLLVKTALYGNDANWGRLMAALGYAGISIREEKVDISINGVTVAKGGMATGRDREANEALKAKEVRLVADLHLGTGRSRVLTCDLTEDYVKINAEYRT